MNDTCALPYADLLPPLSSDEFEALRRSIETHGVLDPVLEDGVGNVLDGHHRLKIVPDAPRRVVPGAAGWTDAEKRAFAFKANFARRNLSPEQKHEADKARRKVAQALAAETNEDGRQKYIQAEIGAMLGVPQQTIASWLDTNKTSSGGFITSAGNKAPLSSGKPKKKRNRARTVKIHAEDHADIYDRWAGGDSDKQIAADYGVRVRRIKQVVAREKERRDKERALEELAKQTQEATNDLGIRPGDFREVGKTLADDSVDLIFTDPPYDRDSLPLYGDLAELAARVLKPGGSLVCYLGQYQIDEVCRLVTSHLRLWWTLAVQHGGPFARMNEYGVVVRWKPLLWFVKGTRGDKQTFVEDLVASEREKDTHDWQQGLAEATYYVEHLCPAGGMVFEPFCGGGTTVVAAKALGRRWLACDSDEDAVKAARRRVHAAE